jgi:hypothetical protein
VKQPTVYASACLRVALELKLRTDIGTQICFFLDVTALLIRPSYDPYSCSMPRCEQAACATRCHKSAIGLHVVRCSENTFTAYTSVTRR